MTKVLVISPTSIYLNSFSLHKCPKFCIVLHQPSEWEDDEATTAKEGGKEMISSHPQE
jgi:hypothetical protein